MIPDGTQSLSIVSIDTIVFDLDGTLVHSPDDGEQRLQAAFARVGVEPFFDLEAFGEALADADGDDPLDHRITACRRLARDHDRDPEAGAAVARAFELPAPEEFRPVPAATEVVRTFRERGYRVGLLTNGPRERQRRKLAVVDLVDGFDAAVYGDPDRGYKPDLAPFHETLDRLGSDPAATVKVGDRLAVDVEPAVDLGMWTVWFPDEAERVPADHPADRVVDDLADLRSEPWDDGVSRTRGRRGAGPD
ncbi:MAG: HAD family hydrolase [Halanaeroarchaeum sp.]